MHTRMLAVTLMIAVPVLSAGCSKKVSFKADIMPIFEEKCLRCHDGSGEGSEKSDFSVLNYEIVMKGTKFGKVVVPGDSNSSTLYRLISHKAHPKVQMPPHHDESLASKKLESLPQNEIDTIKNWIDQGAKNN